MSSDGRGNDGKNGKKSQLHVHNECEKTRPSLVGLF